MNGRPDLTVRLHAAYGAVNDFASHRLEQELNGLDRRDLLTTITMAVYVVAGVVHEACGLDEVTDDYLREMAKVIGAEHLPSFGGVDNVAAFLGAAVACIDGNEAALARFRDGTESNLFAALAFLCGGRLLMYYRPQHLSWPDYLDLVLRDWWPAVGAERREHA